VEHCVGIDVSLELSSVCVVDGRGKIVKEAKVASEPEGSRAQDLDFTALAPVSSYVTGFSNVRDTIPFPPTPGERRGIEARA
jgi:hypothetical protein